MIVGSSCIHATIASVCWDGVDFDFWRSFRSLWVCQKRCKDEISNLTDPLQSHSGAYIEQQGKRVESSVNLSDFAIFKLLFYFHITL